ncbi:Zinc finger, CCHC-type, partial [Kalmanozyma brasiliensis GHG001]|uniref:Zinc finger, CCHC-type n=1 Tax=Kalmanozyma brasiliensis (strain GHG001) TaxID=1365824 RepID=UPI001CE79DE9
KKIKISSALFAGNEQLGTRTNKGRHQRKPRGRECWHCGEIGHFAKDCPNEAQEGAQDGKTSKKGNKTTEKKDGSVFVTIDGDCVQSPHLWLLDGGASRHICVDDTLFDRITPSSDQILTADGRYTKASGVGTVTLKVNLGYGKQGTITLLDVLYMPTFAINLISQGAMHGLLRLQRRGSATLALNRQGEVVCRAMHIGNLAYLNVAGAKVANLVVSSGTADVWHKRLGHPSLQRMKELGRTIPEICTNGGDFKCDVCEINKSHKLPFNRRTTVSHRPLELVHTDVVGRMPDESPEGYRYAVTFVDNYTRFTTVYLMQRKSEVFEHFKTYKARMETQTGSILKRIRSDNGGEYISKEFDEYMATNGIIHELTCPYTPEQNGIAERMNRTLFKKVRCMLSECGAPRKMWGEALLHATYLTNRLPTKATNLASPVSLFLGSETGTKDLRVFGCAAWVHIPEERRDKLGERAIRAAYLGIAADTKGHKLIDPLTGTILVSRHVRFDENRFPFKTRTLGDLARHTKSTGWPILQSEDHEPLGEIINTHADDTIASDSDEQGHTASEPGTPPLVATNDDDDEIGTPPPVALATIEGDTATSGSISELDNEPWTLKAAMGRPDWPLWEEAIKRELESHATNNTWTVVPTPTRANIIGCKWVFKVKRKADGSIDKYKARLVAQGFSQKHGIDYDETFAPVVKLKTLRLLMILSLQLGLTIYQMDVVTAYLNGDIDTDIHMRVPPLAPDMELAGTTPADRNPTMNKNTSVVCKLNKSLYGLKQAGQNWYQKADSTLIQMGFTRNEHDPALYTKTIGQGPPVLLTLYVDDVLIFAKEKRDADNVMEQLRSHFKMTGGDELSYILGIQVQTSSKGTHLSQTSYIRRLLLQFGLQDSNSVTTPINPGVELTGGEQLDEMKHSTYRTIVGSILYIATCTRPDIAFAVQKLSRHLENPTEEAMKAAKHALKYLKGTDTMGLMYSRQRELSIANDDFGKLLETYTDADFAGDTETRKSTTGMINNFAGMPFSWLSKRQGLVTDSTCHAEYVAMHEGVKELTWSRRLLATIGVKIELSSPLLVDNTAAAQLAKDPKFHNRTKHIDVKYHFIREAVEQGMVDVQVISTHDQLADIMTKPLQRVKVVENREGLRIIAPDGAKPVERVN